MDGSSNVDVNSMEAGTGDSKGTPSDTAEQLVSNDLCTSNPKVDDSGPLVNEFDPRQRYRCRGEPVDNFEDLSRWSIAEDGSSLSATTDGVYSGTQSALVTTPAEVNSATIYRTFENGLDLSEWDASVAIDAGSGESRPSSLYLQLFAPDAENRVDMVHNSLLIGGWERLEFGPTNVVGSPDLSDVRTLRLRNYSGSERPAEFRLDELRRTRKMDRGKVLVTFDDNHITQYDTAFPIMEKHGFQGAVGVIPGYTKRENRAGIAELTELQNAGWDIVSHPQLDGPLPGYPKEKQERAIVETKRWLVDNGFERGSRFIIWPYGRASAYAMELASKYHRLGFCGGRCSSGLITDPLTISRVNGDDVEETLEVVDFAEEYRQTAVIMYHTIGVDAVDAEAFETTIEHVTAADVDVLTPSDLWDEQFAGGEAGTGR